MWVPKFPTFKQMCVLSKDNLPHKILHLSTVWYCTPHFRIMHGYRLS